MTAASSAATRRRARCSGARRRRSSRRRRRREPKTFGSTLCLAIQRRSWFLCRPSARAARVTLPCSRRSAASIASRGSSVEPAGAVAPLAPVTLAGRRDSAISRPADSARSLSFTLVRPSASASRPARRNLPEQLPHVAGPGAQRAHLEQQGVRAEPRVHALELAGGEPGHVLQAFEQGGEGDLGAPMRLVEVLPEAAGGHLDAQVPEGRGADAHVDLARGARRRGSRPRAARGRAGAWLHGHVELRDLVEEERAAVRGLHVALGVRGRAGVRPLAGAEEQPLREARRRSWRS